MKLADVVMIGASLFVLVVKPAIAAGGLGEWSYKDWYAYRTASVSAQDEAMTCAMEDDSPATVGLRVSHFTLDAGPPYFFPAVTRVPDLQGRPIPVPDPLNSTWTFDGGTPINVPLTFDYVDGENRLSAPSDQTQKLLELMAKSSEVVIEDEIFSPATHSLAGFTANYRKIAEWCDFTVEGVLD